MALPFRIFAATMQERTRPSSNLQPNSIWDYNLSTQHTKLLSKTAQLNEKQVLLYLEGYTQWWMEWVLLETRLISNTDNGWNKAVAAATKPENTIITANKAMPAHSDFYGREASYVRHLCTFGEYGVMHYEQKIWSKLRNHQHTCILSVTQMIMQEMYTAYSIYVCNVCGSCVMSSQSNIWKNECRTLHPGCWNSSTCHRNSTGWWRRRKWCKQPW